MIDIHCHTLPFLDDGAKNWDISLRMARMAFDDGIRECITTPHWTGRREDADVARARLEEFRGRLAVEGITLQAHPGNEVILIPSLVEALREGWALTLGGTKYVLLETAQLEHGPFNRAAIFQIQSSGYRVILAHPERVPSWEKDLTGLRELVNAGCYLQVNAMSILGGFGKGPRAAVEQFLKLGWVSLLASDAHSAESRPPLVSAALEACASWIGGEAADDLVTSNPARVLKNQLLPYVDADPLPPKRRFSFPWPFGRRD